MQDLKTIRVLSRGARHKSDGTRISSAVCNVVRAYLYAQSNHLPAPAGQDSPDPCHSDPASARSVSDAGAGGGICLSPGILDASRSAFCDAGNIANARGNICSVTFMSHLTGGNCSLEVRISILNATGALDRTSNLRPDQKHGVLDSWPPIRLV